MRPESLERVGREHLQGHRESCRSAGLGRFSRSLVSGQRAKFSEPSAVTWVGLALHSRMQGWTLGRREFQGSFREPEGSGHHGAAGITGSRRYCVAKFRSNILLWGSKPGWAGGRLPLWQCQDVTTVALLPSLVPRHSLTRTQWEGAQCSRQGD